MDCSYRGAFTFAGDSFSSFFGSEPSAGDGETEAILAFIGGAAIAIERLIEAGWTLVGGVAGTYWPLNTISDQVNTMLASLDNAFKLFHKELVEKVQAVIAGIFALDVFQAVLGTVPVDANANARVILTGLIIG